MYTGYNLSLTDVFDETIYQSTYDKGKAMYDVNKKKVIEELDKFINTNGILNGTEMENSWFPQINVDVFISHSHQDERLAIILAGLFDRFHGLKVFIDSCVWSYADDLLIKIDNEYCKNEDGSFNYERRNFSTSHVHMMLNTALMKMIDKTECIIFLNTPSSISASEITNNTKSPWIYSELSMTRMLGRTLPSRLLQEINKGEVRANKNLQIVYEVELDHLTELTSTELISWIRQGMSDNNRGSAQLDTLYNRAGGRPKTKVINEYFTK